MKIPKYTFCRRFNSVILSTSYEFYYDDITVMSFINIRYGNVAVEIIPQGTAFCYSFAVGKGLSANAIQSEMRPVYGDKYFTRPAIHLWCKKFAHGHNSVVDEEEPGCCVVSTTDATIAAVIPSCGQTGM